MARDAAPCIIFIDEIDSLAQSRKSVVNYTQMSLNQLLTEMDGFRTNSGVVVLAATNLLEHIDSALTRSGRFDRTVTLELPDKRVRKEILELYLKDKAPGANIDEIAAVSMGCSGADLYNVVNTALIEAIKHNKTHVTTELLQEALSIIQMGRKKVNMGVDEAQRKLTAYHEAGHALVSHHTPGSPGVSKITLIPRGLSLGATMQVPKESNTRTLRELNAQLAVAMGGTAAEELIFGPSNITTGASSDLDHATRLAHQMVTRFGMSKAVGKRVVENDHRHTESSSPKLLSLVDEEVKHLTDSAYQHAVKLLTEKTDELHALAKALLEKETLSREEILQVLQTVKK
jgi:ATP-dependent metalloprotease